jgi:hypothetical protein
MVTPLCFYFDLVEDFFCRNSTKKRQMMKEAASSTHQHNADGCYWCCNRTISSTTATCSYQFLFTAFPKGISPHVAGTENSVVFRYLLAGLTGSGASAHVVCPKTAGHAHISWGFDDPLESLSHLFR